MKQTELGLILVATLLIAAVVCFAMAVITAGLHPMIGHVA